MRILVLAILAVLIAPRGAAAQSAVQPADVKYCQALAEKYDAYLDTAGDKGGRATPVEVTLH